MGSGFLFVELPAFVCKSPLLPYVWTVSQLRDVLIEDTEAVWR